MASSVFFKFKSQKEPTRVEFDGTGISVFELKRDIITKSGLGDGTDFDLAIYTDDGKEEYDDDTTIIPRSTIVIARRLPPMKPGAGRAARYVSGKMPVNAKNSSRKEQAAKAATKSTSNAFAQMNSAMTEEEKMAAMFQAQSEQWSAQQEEMAHQQPVFNKSGNNKKPANVPDHDPPQGYICYRCGEKGHWIQLCPTNDNPDFDNRPRVKRTTGIPKSFLKTVDKATALAQHGEGDDSKTPSGIMVNADGEFVIAEPDKAAWVQYQAKAKTMTASLQLHSSQGDKEVQELGLECPIDKRMFIDPMKTPCCEKTYCNDCITNALIESDLICPGCQTEGVLIDDLKPDDDAATKIKDYLAEKTTSKVKEESKSPVAAASPKSQAAAEAKPSEVKVEQQSKAKSKSPPPAQAASKSPATQASQDAPNPTPPRTSSSTTSVNGDSSSKKRPAEDVAENPKIPRAPKAMQQKVQAPQSQQATMMQMMNGMPLNSLNGMAGMNAMPMMPFPGMPMMPAFNGMPSMNNMNMGMMPPTMMNAMMGSMAPGFNMNGMNGAAGGAGFPNIWNDMNDGMSAGKWSDMNGGGMNHGGNNMNMNMSGMANGGGTNPNGGFNQYHQQHYNHHLSHRNFASHQPTDEEDAYFRKPVNPHRHQNRQRRARPSDYREL